MNAIFELANRASVEAIRTRMTGPPSYSTVRVILTRLEKKGYVKHQYDGVRYIYSATISPAAAKKTALQQFLRTFFGGSMMQMMTALVREGSWSVEELNALKGEVEQARKERKQS